MVRLQSFYLCRLLGSCYGLFPLLLNKREQILHDQIEGVFVLSHALRSWVIIDKSRHHSIGYCSPCAINLLSRHSRGMQKISTLQRGESTAAKHAEQTRKQHFRCLSVQKQAETEKSCVDPLSCRVTGQAFIFAGISLRRCGQHEDKRTGRLHYLYDNCGFTVVPLFCIPRRCAFSVVCFGKRKKPKSESQEAETKSQKPKVKNQKPEIKSQKSKGKSQKAEEAEAWS